MAIFGKRKSPPKKKAVSRVSFGGAKHFIKQFESKREDKRTITKLKRL